MNTDEIFERGTGDWEKLLNFMDEYNFSCGDYLACICAHLSNQPEQTFNTQIMLQGEKFSIQIKKDINNTISGAD